ncbi:hypothetical protein LCM00_16995 [Bacillus infantis]|uniref:hypothetical protein n=1 Tax=Bacillus infantis TaxID=324767 RepID=UPI001CD5A417|nr:hypothetical protein [Bacillus infantis]MCA1041215.1 hypothetical protein [Bacillus infantis]
MEKILVKTGVYSFIIPFFILVAFTKREDEATNYEGYTSTIVTPYAEYFFTIFRYSVIASLLAVGVAFAYLMSEKKRENGEEQGE